MADYRIMITKNCNKRVKSKSSKSSVLIDFQTSLPHGSGLPVKVDPILFTFDDNVIAKREKFRAGEKTLLFASEEIIRQGWDTFRAVGLALNVIKDGQLYRRTHETFIDYCRDELNLKHMYECDL